jgi:hypothetical protein
MAGGASSGNFGVESYTEQHGKAVTPVPPETGRTPELADGARGAKEGVSGMGAKHMRQAAPDHGPIPDHHVRGERKAY